MEQAPPAAEGQRHEAFARYVVPELPVLLRVARTLTPSEQDAEDLVQDTILRAFRAADRFDGAHTRAWLLTIMRNAQVNRTRRRRPELLADPAAANDVIDTQRDGLPEASAEASALGDAVSRALSRLPERMARAVELVDMDGLSYAEAAEALGVPVGTVMSRLHRGRTKIRAQLERTGLVFRGGDR